MEDLPATKTDVRERAEPPKKHRWIYLVRAGALSDFDGVFLPDFGTQHLPANYLSDNSCEIPIASKSSAKVAAPGAATFEPMYV